MKKLLVASTNDGKIDEIRSFLDNFNFEFTGLQAFPEIGEIEEDGNSFKENALKKAKTGAEYSGLMTLADDSGLVVEYLEGAPGIYSARFAGEDATDEENNEKLLHKLKAVPRKERKAYFKCVMALVLPEAGNEFTFTGKCEGLIAKTPRGAHGFGYDPLFYVPEYDRTMAELPPEIKNKISHRARALEKMREFLQDYL